MSRCTGRHQEPGCRLCRPAEAYYTCICATCREMTVSTGKGQQIRYSIAVFHTAITSCHNENFFIAPDFTASTTLSARLPDMCKTSDDFSFQFRGRLAFSRVQLSPEILAASAGLYIMPNPLKPDEPVVYTLSAYEASSRGLCSWS